MKNIGILSFCILIMLALCFVYCQQQDKKIELAQPKSYQVEEGDNTENRENWLETIHRAAPGTNWQAIDNTTRLEQYERKKTLRGNSSRNAQEVLANGNLVGKWFERGSNNLSGSIRKVAYDKDKNIVYAISDGGTIWQGNLDGSSWTPKNEDLRFGPKILKLTTNAAGTKRLLAAIGKTVYYSDDEGLTWDASTGFNFTTTWGDNENASKRDMVILNDANKTIYYYTNYSEGSSGGERVQLFRSIDNGTTFTKIFGTTHNKYNQVSMWSPHNSSEAYFLDRNSDLYQINGASLTLLNSNDDISAGFNQQLEGHKSDSITTFYVLTAQHKLYRSTDNGANFDFIGTTPNTTFRVGIGVSLSDANTLYTGEVYSYRSTDGGLSWTVVNDWRDYYDDPLHKIHADIMDFSSFKKADGTEFTLISNHGGLSISYDKMLTNTNIGLADLNVSQYYNSITSPSNPDMLYAGSQDQGWQRSFAANNSTVLDLEQARRGDYGYLTLVNNGQSLFMVYPGGTLNFYQYPTSQVYPSSSWELPGLDRPAGDWIIPIEATTNTASLEVYMAGGNISGNSGSYLIKLTASIDPDTITPFQYNYNFKTNSTTGTGLIASIEASEIDVGRLYVGASDGSFFYSNDNGNSWTKSSSFDDPSQSWLYGATIVASKLTPDLVYYGGSGYSNPGVYVSTNGGQTFTPMTNGLPSTVVYDLATNNDESLLFAATDVGPYVYVFAEDTWYDMRGLNAPQQVYRSVEFVDSSNTVRFTTFGRGIWDFAIQTLLGCAEPCNISASVISGNVLRLSWDAAASAERYRIRYRTIGGTWIEKLTARDETYRFLNGLTESTTYEYQIKTLCVAANSVWSPIFTISTSTYKCDFPESSTADNLSATTASISWSPDPDDLKYKLKYKADEGQNAWIELNFVGPNKNISGLNAGTLYKYKLKTKCAGGWTNWNSNAFFSTSNFVNTDINARATNFTNIKTYPNPVNDLLTIELDSEKVAAITIHDINGQLKKQIITINDTQQIDVSMLPPNTYYLSIVMKDHSLVSKNFIKK